MKYTEHCTETCKFTVRPVPGAIAWPKRLECVEHGYPVDRRAQFAPAAQESEKPNNYFTEIASPADITETTEGNFYSQY